MRQYETKSSRKLAFAGLLSLGSILLGACEGSEAEPVASSEQSAETSPQQADRDICTNGAIYESSDNGFTVTVTRIGSGKSDFTGSGKPQAGMALDFVLYNGQHGAIFGPMRSIMFPTDVNLLNDEGYQWRPANADPGGFFTVRSDDGEEELFTLSFVGCAH